jgi:hypothetical protein
LIEFLARYDPRVRKMLLDVRQFVLREIPMVSETVNDVLYAVTVGFTFSGRFKEAFCYAVAYNSHVNLGFNRGTELPDPERKLQGTGKLNRHVRIDSPADLEDPAIRQLIRAAADHAAIAGGPVVLKPQVVVKPSPARKRREAERLK